MKPRMNQEPPLADSQNESRIGTCCMDIKNISCDCYECLTDFFSNLWDSTCFFFYDVWDWTSSKCSCCSTKKPEVGGNFMKISPKSTKQAAKGILKANPPTENDKELKTDFPTSPNSPQIQHSFKQASPQFPPSPQASPMNPVESTIRSSIARKSDSKLVQERSRIVQEQNHESTTIEPPKIDFVETGSIFGDRKKANFDVNTLQIENGRFRSPGLSKIVRGPGGRNIRVSFVTGFPSYKSIDSRSSLTQNSKTLTKKSTDSMQLNVYKSANSLESNKQAKKGLAIKSNKSFKSSGSIEDSKNIDRVNSKQLT